MSDCEDFGMINGGHGEWFPVNDDCIQAWVDWGNDRPDGIDYAKVSHEDGAHVRCEWTIVDREQLHRYYERRELEEGWDED